MTFDQKFIVAKLDELHGYSKELDELLRFSDGEIIADQFKLHAAERLLQLAVDTMIDINQHFIRELKLKIGDDFQSTFYTLGSQDILPVPFAEKIAPIVGLRNRIVHRYETLDKKLFLHSLRNNISDIEIYIKHIVQYSAK